MRVAERFIFLGISFLTLSAQVASANCRLFLAQGGGFSLFLKTPNDKNNRQPVCDIKQLELELSVGGESLTIAPGNAWQLGTKQV